MQSRISVLLVEDHEPFAEGLKTLMGSTFDVRWVNSVSQVKQALEEQPVDVIVLDLCLPDSKGAATVKRVLEIAPGTPIVVYSATADADEIQAALLSGAQQVIDKAERSSALINAIVKLAIEQSRRTEAEKTALVLHDQLTSAQNNIAEVRVELRRVFRIAN